MLVWRKTFEDERVARARAEGRAEEAEGRARDLAGRLDRQAQRLEDECAARARAEAERARADDEVSRQRREIARLGGLLADERRRHADESRAVSEARVADLLAQAERHAQATQDLLDHIAPKPGEQQPDPAAGYTGPALSAEQIRAMPATTRREMFLREKYALAAEAHARADTGKKEMEERRKDMTQKEKQTLDESIVGRIE